MPRLPNFKTLSPTLRGMLWMAASGFSFTILNATLKHLSQNLEPLMVGFLRYGLGALVIIPLVLRVSVATLRPRKPGMQFARGALHTAGIMFWFAALPVISLAELTAIGFSGPIFICLGAVAFLGERMTMARWLSVLIGFGGVLLVVMPGGGGGGFAGISRGTLMLLCSVPLFAGSFLVAKALTRHERLEVVVLWQHVWTAALLLPFAYAAWTPPNALQWAMLIVCGFIGAGGHYCMVRAFRAADISAVQPVKFLDLIWASLLGFAVFGDLPTTSTLLGAIVILASTLWLARRESRGMARPT